MRGQVNLYVYDPDKLKCNVDKVAQQLCKKVNYPLHVRKIFNVEKSEAWKDALVHTHVCGIVPAEEEGDCEKAPVYSVILVEYQSLCSDISGCTWWKWFSMTESQENYQLNGEYINDLAKVCETIRKKSITYPVIILSRFKGSNTEKEKVERNLRMYGIPNNWSIYLDENDESKNLEGLEFNINHFMRTFWQNNFRHWIPNKHHEEIWRLTNKINAEARDKAKPKN
jgi:hypothetical protein